MIMHQEAVPHERAEPAPAAPVRLQGRMGLNGYEAENAAWIPYLTYPDRRLGTRHDGSPRLAGHDPMKLPPELLTKAGHPKRSMAQLRLALGNPNRLHTENADGDLRLDEVRVYRDVKAYCDGCAGDAQSRRRCAIDALSILARSHGTQPAQPEAWGIEFCGRKPRSFGGFTPRRGRGLYTRVWGRCFRGIKPFLRRSFPLHLKPQRYEASNSLAAGAYAARKCPIVDGIQLRRRHHEWHALVFLGCGRICHAERLAHVNNSRKLC